MRAFALITTLILTSILLFLATSFVIIVISESKISQAHTNGIKAYYIAEAGINKAIWMVKNDPDWKENFETMPNWQASLEENGYTVQIQNSALAKASITSIGKFRNAQRIVKTTVFKALIPQLPEDIAMYSGDTILCLSSIINTHNSGIFSNNNISGIFHSNIYADKDIASSSNIYSYFSSSIQSNTSVNANYCYGNISPWPCNSAHSIINPPSIDFDSASPNSYKNKADAIYSTAGFRNALKQNPNLTLNGIIYVTGNVRIKRGQHLTINGLLVADGSILVGTEWLGWNKAYLTINNTTGEPSGILSKNTIQFGTKAGTININGLVYALKNINFGYGAVCNITGGIISANQGILINNKNIDITYNSDIINTTIGAPEFSPTITIEHWEEEY